MEKMTIPASRYAELLKAEAQLRALEAAGVDNWEGYCTVGDEDEDDA